MITLSCNRVRALLVKKGIKLEDLNDTFFFATDATNQLNRIHHENVMKITYNDEFIYELAKALNVSCDYLLGWTEDPDIFVPSVGNDPIFKLKELRRMMLKYCYEQQIDIYNTNILAGLTNIDRDIFTLVFDALDKTSSHCAWWVTTSYYIVSRLSQAFDFNFYTVMAYMLQAEDDDKDGKKYLLHLVDRYNKEFGTDIQPTPGS